MRQARTWRNGMRALLAAAVLAALLMVGVALAETYPFTTVTTDQVNLRRSASSTATILDRVAKGDSITVLGASGNYYRVTYNGRTGYVLKVYVSTAADTVVTPTPTQEPTASGYPYDTVTTDKVNLRAARSTSSRKVCTIPSGAALTVHSVSGTFAKVTYNGHDGYVKKDYIVVKRIVKPTATPAPVPTLSPEENAAGYSILQKGSTGSQVTALQEAMIELGYLTGKADGIFGDGTQQAIVAFQTKNKYPATGVVDANLQAFLYSGKPLNAQGEKTQIKTLAPVPGVTIRLNNRGELVRTVQTRLKELGYYTGEVTGTYDKATQSAVKSFQKKNNLKSDGVCGAETQKVLLGGSALSTGATPTPTPTALPTPAPTFALPGGTVREGSTGDDARMVQQRLKDLGYLTGRVDGKFGSASVKALKAFQTKHGLEADGVAGSGTYAVLFSYQALAANELPTAAPTAVVVVTPAPTATMEPVTQENVVVIKLGVRGQAVVYLQQRLTALGYYQATVDGECKADDVAAIKAFQRLNGLKVDGVAGYDTQSRMYSPSAVMDSGAIAGGNVDTYTTLRKGDTGESVRMLQQRLAALGYMTLTDVDGRYGVKTAEAVIRFQRANGLTRDGVAGSKTLTLLYSATAATPTPAPATTPAPGASQQTLHQGDASDAVRTLQQRLIELGYLTGKADGKFGVQTYRALLAFQRANRLLADGVAGSLTWAMLNSVNAVGANGATAAPQATTPPASSGGNNGGTGTSVQLLPSNVVYENWYSSIRAKARQYPYATIYDFNTGISWQVHMFSLGAHADSEPLTANDTAKMLKAFGGKNTWNAKPVWVIFGDGTIYMASTHSMPHGVQHRTDNNFGGHFCIHFPRTASQVAAIGVYATSHQKAIDDGWKQTQALIK